MASADFSAFSHASLHELNESVLHGFIRIVETSPDKSDNFLPMCLVHLHRKVRAVLDFALFSKLVRLAILSVRQAGNLPPTSFRFHLAVDTLALS
jgi:hypothetical protein